MAKIMVQIEANDEYFVHDDLVRFLKKLQTEFHHDEAGYGIPAWTLSVVEEDGLVPVSEAKFN
jgi:peroxiredoxin